MLDFVVFDLNGKYEEIKIKTVTFWKDVSIILVLGLYKLSSSSVD